MFPQLSCEFDCRLAHANTATAARYQANRRVVNEHPTRAAWPWCIHAKFSGPEVCKLAGELSDRGDPPPERVGRLIKPIIEF
jgi:hypothetical protein